MNSYFPALVRRFIFPATALVALLFASGASAATRTWSGAGDTWDLAANWTGNAKPVNTDSLVFSAVGSGNLISNDNIYDLYLAKITFAAGAPAYTLHLNQGNYLDISGAGIENLSGQQQTIITEGPGGSAISFSKTAKAGNINIVNTNGGSTYFLNTSNAENATITNELAHVSASLTWFQNDSKAGNAHIINRSLTRFDDKSSADSSIIANEVTGALEFLLSSSGGQATITSNGLVTFDDSSTAGTATVTSNGGRILFDHNATAGASTLIANASTDGSAGGRISFLENSKGGTARIIINTGGLLDVSGNNEPYGYRPVTALSVGSIEGAGEVRLGAVPLTVGTANTDTTFSGNINGTGNFIKSGTGVLTLSGVNTYTGSTTVTGAGAISVSSFASGTNANLGPGALILTAGGTLRYTGAATTNDRLIQFGTTATGGSGRVESSGTGALNLSNTAVAFGTTNQTRTVILGGTNTDENIFAASLSANGTGAVSLQKTGTGTWTLTGTNTYTGNTTINGGILKLGAARATSMPLVINATAADGTATFDLNGNSVTAGVLTFGGTTAGANATNTFTTGAATLTLGSTVTYTAATLAANDPGKATISGLVALGATRTFAIADSTNTATELEISAAISGTGGITKTGAGVLLLSGANTNSGTTTVNNGTVRLGSSDSIRSAGVAVTVNATTASGAATFDLNGKNAAVNVLTFGGTTAGANAVNTLSTGAGTLTINSNAVYTVATLAANDPGTAVLSGKVTLNGTRTFTIANSSNTDTELEISAAIAGSAGSTGLTKAGLGTLALSGTNTYTGTTTVSAGALQVGNGGTTGSVAGVIVNNATLAFDRSNTLGHALGISGTGTVIQQGSGTLTLGANNSYSGGTVINNGTLAVDHNNALGSGGVTVNSGTLLVNNGRSISNAVTLAGGSYDRTLANGSSLAGVVNATSNFAGGRPDTTASILQGTLTIDDATTTLESSFSEASLTPNDAYLASDIYHFLGTEDSIFVLELGATGLNAGSYLGWLNPESGEWVNAVEGNSSGTAFFVNGAYNTATDFHLGYWGVDTANNKVWAVVDHNSLYAIVVPEPSSFALLVIGLGFLSFRVRRRVARS